MKSILTIQVVHLLDNKLHLSGAKIKIPSQASDSAETPKRRIPAMTKIPKIHPEIKRFAKKNIKINPSSKRL